MFNLIKSFFKKKPRIAYKATYNYKCINQLYEIGKEYKMEEKPIVCVRGFHYCRNAEDVLNYYEFYPTFKLLEIEDLSKDTIHFGDKSCSNNIKILREITDPDELFKLLNKFVTFYEDGNRKYEKRANKCLDLITIIETDYHQDGLKVFYKCSSGYWYRSTYDNYGNRLTYENSYGEKRNIND